MPRPGADLRTALATLVAVLLCASASAQVFYKWTDADGKIHYADKPPAGFKGTVTRIDTGDIPKPPPLPDDRILKSPEDARDAADEKAEEEKSTLNAKRKAQRERLAARVEIARAKLEKARKALEEGDEPREGERTYVQQRFARSERRPERTPAPHVNCMSQYAADGTPIWNCPRPIPNEAYYERQKALEDAVKKAEEELADAERAYRQGVD